MAKKGRSASKFLELALIRVASSTPPFIKSEIAAHDVGINIQRRSEGTDREGDSGLLKTKAERLS